nr:MAG TPA: hypothetical protein [Herelleviridae sp.]
MTSLMTTRERQHWPRAAPRRTGRDWDIRHLVSSWGWVQKSKTTLPGYSQPPGPHGHPDVALPICDQHPTTGALVARNEKHRSSYHVGHGKGDGYACEY